MRGIGWALLASLAMWAGIGAACHAVAAPLALNPACNGVPIERTICLPGWATAQRRAGASKVARIKRQLGAQPGQIADHIVSIELCGAVTAKANIQLQSRLDSVRKDRIEDRLSRDVCAHKIALPEAQRQVAAWH